MYEEMQRQFYNNQKIMKTKLEDIYPDYKKLQ